MEKSKILYVNQAMMPYLEEGELTSVCRKLPQAIQEAGKEIRNFMPRYGCINERRHQLHEVIRLSGMNLVVDDHDHPLIIKVASIPQAKMQVYFIDNEEFFKRKSALSDDNMKAHADNDERMIFYCKGVAETVKKLGWSPDVVHCHGWFASLLPLYIKKVFHNEPLFRDSKVIFSIYSSVEQGGIDKKLYNKLLSDNFEEFDIDSLKKPDYDALYKMGASMADGIIIGDEMVDSEMIEWAKSLGKPVLDYPGRDDYAEAYNSFYDEILELDAELAE
ncbi:MAG: glycogen synthase [Crocinitomicaceae bacterium]|nr:glycogen synthase [Crocinitomicaceae bacterium]